MDSYSHMPNMSRGVSYLKQCKVLRRELFKGADGKEVVVGARQVRRGDQHQLANMASAWNVLHSGFAPATKIFPLRMSFELPCQVKQRICFNRAFNSSGRAFLSKRGNTDLHSDLLTGVFVSPSSFMNGSKRGIDKDIFSGSLGRCQTDLLQKICLAYDKIFFKVSDRRMRLQGHVFYLGQVYPPDLGRHSAPTKTMPDGPSAFCCGKPIRTFNRNAHIRIWPSFAMMAPCMDLLLTILVWCHKLW